MIVTVVAVILSGSPAVLVAHKRHVAPIAAAPAVDLDEPAGRVLHGKPRRAGQACEPSFRTLYVGGQAWCIRAARE